MSDLQSLVQLPGDVPDHAPLAVQLIGRTEFLPPADVPWSTDATGGPALVEFAGRACYQSWSKPNPATATNAGYLAHILDVAHLSVLEHGVATLYVTGVSRSLTHELIRHRHLSPSQLSQWYVPEGDAAMVVPAVIAQDPELLAIFDETSALAVEGYRRLLAGLEETYSDEPNRTARRKKARQAARSVLPNATETRIVLTGNFRTWRHFLHMRGSAAADVEIRELAVHVHDVLVNHFPQVFADFTFVPPPAGSTEVGTLTSPLAGVNG